MWELDYKEIWAQKNWCFWTVVLRRLLRVPWTIRRSTQSVLKEISPGCSLEGLMLKLKLQYFGHLMQKLTHLKIPWCWERVRVGGERDDRGWDGWMASPTQWTWVWVNSGSWWWTGRPGVLQFMGSQRVGHNWATELNWTLRKRWNGDSTCSFTKLKQKVFSSFNLSHSLTQKGPSWAQYAVQLWNVQRDMSLQHQRQLPATTGRCDRHFSLGFSCEITLLSDLSVCTWPFSKSVEFH